LECTEFCRRKTILRSATDTSDLIATSIQRHSVTKCIIIIIIIVIIVIIIVIIIIIIIRIFNVA